ncbi:MAG: fibronectin type III domain-containing protein [Chloroflexi bacterium]|nr:fibronectin type III domain-containing protein [Chloroflexota bacterium]
MNVKIICSQIIRGLVIILLALSMSGLLPRENVFASNGIYRSPHSTDVGGMIDTNTTWNLAGSPYIVLAPLLVVEGVTLTIDPGVTVKFASHKALQIDGQLHAVGTSGSPITFTSNIVPSHAGDWDYIVFTDTSVDAVYDIDGNYESGSIIKYAVIEYAGGASVSDNGALRLNGAAPFITYTTIHNSATAGIRGFNNPGTLKMTHNSVTDNSGVGISVTNGYSGYTEISYSTINNNTNSTDNPSDGGGIFVDGSATVINNNTIRNNTALSNGAGLYAVWGSTATINNNLVADNSIYNCPLCWDRYSVIVYGFNPSTISGNVIINNATGGILSVHGGHGDIFNNIISYNNGIGLHVDSAERSVSHNIISDNTTLINYGGIRAGGNPTITYNSILRNTATNNAAIFLNVAYDVGDFSSNTIMDNVNSEFDNLRAVYIEYGSPTFNGNNIYRNNGYSIYNNNAQGSPTVNAENNWWGTASSPAIQGLVYDWFDDPNKGIVDISPYRTGINTAAPMSPPIGVVVTPSLSMMGVSWTANPESDLAGYKVYWDADSHYPYANSADVGNVTSYNIPGLGAGTDYYIAVTAYDSSRDGSNDMTDGNESWFSVEKTDRLDSPPAAFNKVSPSNGATGQSVSPTLNWETSTDATSYEYCYDTSNDNACSSWASNGTATSKGLSGLSPNTTYYWHVRALNTAGATYSNGSATAFWAFTTSGAPDAFNKTSPPDGATDQSINLILNWGSSNGATSYEYCYDTSNDSACSVWESNAASTSKALNGLSQNTTYYWHVRAINGLGTTYSNGSETAFWSFTTMADPPAAFDKTSPLNGALALPTSLSLIWGASTGADSYEFCYDNTNDGSCSPWTSNGSATSVALTSLTAGATYYWQVRANNVGGATYANSSVWWSFTTMNDVSPFADVPFNYWARSYIERLYAAGVTSGCSSTPLMYCPATPVTRGQMAIFLLRGMHGNVYTPPPATGTRFTDVPLGSFGAAWIEELAFEGITSGCTPTTYCPNTAVTRAQMAIFLVRAKHGIAFVPPTATGIFADVPVGSFGANHIEQLVTDGITSGCSIPNSFCPGTVVTRAQMSVFLVKTFSLP